MPITEIIVCLLVPGSDICGANNSAGAALRDTVDGLRKHTGCQQFTAGMQLEHADMLEALISRPLISVLSLAECTLADTSTIAVAWESLQKHYDFRRTPDYEPVVASIGKIRGSPYTPYHVDFRPFTAFMRATEAPVTEVATFYFDGSAPTAVLDRFTRFREVLSKQQVSGVLGAAAGLTHEELDSEGVRGTAAVLVIGWESVDAHLAFQKTQLFKDSVHLLPVAEAKRIDMVRLHDMIWV
ncbi:hypothetical protein B0A55_07630 [Friedmanniomyces simplex]|uniref:EthD domain-containing protein n=1 Tax=Friedmanniomyces simplex TaxID=329884 RepID=A0A4U0WZX7_9PEZI|nr:hypothetical protein B0A55_07630 [Friedmanniomyces simplex]